ncbi:unnamed protein product [Paramecium octaurelia]|uniref:Uncharacterized protein n=1 Tax=Paramecium octaurelia TaxID=43137 RepID=A0A8S1UA06_PAROT|nr:unnamed protein product [Paramecium octaurelia]
MSLYKHNSYYNTLNLAQKYYQCKLGCQVYLNDKVDISKNYQSLNHEKINQDIACNGRFLEYKRNNDMNILTQMKNSLQHIGSVVDTSIVLSMQIHLFAFITLFLAEEQVIQPSTLAEQHVRQLIIK